MEHTPGKTLQMRYLELQRGQTIEQIICSLAEQGLSDEKIAAALGISRLTLHRWNKLLGRETVVSKKIRFPSTETASVP
jgi:response regulator of citrate/malate metabolism